MKLSAEAVVGERLRRNLLVPGAEAGSAVEVVEALCGVQAQELPAARLAVRARSAGLTDAGVEAARVEDRSIVRTWAMRGTLHLAASKDLEWLRRLLSAGSIKANTRRSVQLGLDEATYRKAMDVIDRALAGGVALNRAGLREALEAGGVDASGQRAPYLLARATAEGLICEGPQVGRYPTYVRVEDWLGRQSQATTDRKDDLNRLVHRYLGAYGPAGPEDLAMWSGLAIPECRDAFQGAEPELTEVSSGGRQLWTAGEVRGGDPVGVRLLPAFDTFLLGYRDRSLHLDPAHAKRVNAGGGIVKPVVLVAGRVAGTWRLVHKPKGAAVSVRPFTGLPDPAMPEFEREAADIGRFLDVPVSLTVEGQG